MEDNFWINFNVNTHFYALLFANKGCIFFYCRLVLVGKSWCVCCALLFELSFNVLCSHSFMCRRLIVGKRINLLYQQFLFSVSDLNVRIWLSSQSIVDDQFEPYLSWKILGNVDTDTICMFVLNTNSAVHQDPVFFQGMPLKWIQECPALFLNLILCLQL